MSNLHDAFKHIMGKISSSWSQMPAEIQRVVLFVSVAALLPWLTITTHDIQNWVIGAEQVLAGRSVYEPRATSDYTGQVVPRYPYLPSFAMLLALGIAPFSFLHEVGLLPTVVYEAFARLIANAPGYIGLLGIPFIIFRIHNDFDTKVGSVKDTAENWAFWGVLIVVVAPPLWIQVIESGSDALVALLVCLGVYLIMKSQWLLAGLVVGAATFKFTALPIAAVFALYALSYGRDQLVALSIGGIVSQVPNAVYFAAHIPDLVFLYEQQGMLTYQTGKTTALVTAPFRILNLEQWYIDVGFLIPSVVLVILGAIVAIHRRNLVLGSAVAYLSSSYFAPVGEVKTAVLVVLLLTEAAVNVQHRHARYLAAGVLIIFAYALILPFGLINYASVPPWPWWDTAVQAIKFGVITVALVGLLRISDHRLFQSH